MVQAGDVARRNAPSGAWLASWALVLAVSGGWSAGVNPDAAVAGFAAPEVSVTAGRPEKQGNPAPFSTPAIAETETSVEDVDPTESSCHPWLGTILVPRRCRGIGETQLSWWCDAPTRATANSADLIRLCRLLL